MAPRHPPRHPLFSQRLFADDIIITCVRWHLRFKLSYRDLAELARELGVSVAPSTVLRWVVRYVPEFEKRWQAYEWPVGDSWRVDETYLKVGDQWARWTATRIGWFDLKVIEGFGRIFWPGINSTLQSRSRTAR